MSKTKTKNATKNTTDAIALLKKDHQSVRALFDRFERTEETSKRREIVEAACAELKVHAAVEERLFYPALRQEMADEAGLIDEADEEHHEVKILMAELDMMDGSEENYCAKFEVLSENVRHHMKEEEGSMFPKAKKTAIDLSALGERMRELKARLEADGVEPGAEERMVAEFGVAEKSPSRSAQASFSAPIKGRP